jgi:hypothetical protein
MEPNQFEAQGQPTPKTSAKDFFLNLGAIVALYATVISLLNLLFTVINKAFPKVINNYNYYNSSSISFPVAVLIIFFPIFILLMWVLERGYVVEPQKKHIAVRRWLTYITLFVAGLTLAGDLVTVLYYFLDGQELTMGFLLKILAVLVVTSVVFTYYISDIREKLTGTYRKIWLSVSILLILLSIIWGFAVLGSPRTQQLMKYDQQKVYSLQEISYQISNYYQKKGSLPNSLNDLSADNSYFMVPLDSQKNTPFEYVLVGQSAKTYQLCAVFNKASDNSSRMSNLDIWAHPAGRHCFNITIPLDQYVNVKPVPVR